MYYAVPIGQQDRRYTVVFDLCVLEKAGYRLVEMKHPIYVESYM